MRALVAAIALAHATPAWADAPEWRPVDAQTGQIRDIEGLEQLAEDFPDSGSVRLRLLQAQIGAQNVEAALATLSWLKERGYVFSEVAQSQIPELMGEEHAETAKALLIPQAAAIEASEVYAIAPQDAGLVGSVLTFENLVGVTSISEHGIFLSAYDGPWFKVDFGSPNDISGFLYDEQTKTGWVSSGNFDASVDAQRAFSGLHLVDPESSYSALIAAPAGVTVSDMGIANDGRIFASDPFGGGVYAARANERRLTALVPPGYFRSPQGLAVSSDNSKLYVSDYRYGLGIIDLATRKVSRLTSEIPVILDGVDGLWLHERQLIAIQNGTSPMRISAFKLSDDGMRIVSARVLEQAHSGWTEPLGGSIFEGSLVYVATGQWDRYEAGELGEGMEAIPTEIRRLPLSVPAD